MGCPAIDIIEVIYEDDDVRDRYQYKVPMSPCYHQMSTKGNKKRSKEERRMEALENGILDWHNKC